MTPIVQRTIAREAGQRLAAALRLLEAPSIGERTGGLYALEGLSREGGDLQAPLIEVLSAFVRRRAQGVASEADWENGRRIESDIQSALTIMGRCRTGEFATHPLDLHGISLREVFLPFAQLERALLYECDLEGALLCGANLRGAWLWRANLTRVNFDGADLSGADLTGARGFERAQLKLLRYDEATRWPIFSDDAPATHSGRARFAR